jgi:hypothetical protein
VLHTIQFRVFCIHTTPQFHLLFVWVSNLISHPEGDWRKWRNEELHNLYSSPLLLRRVKWAGGEYNTQGRNAYRILVGKPEIKRSPEKHIYR